MATIHDVAASAGVSATTVSRYLNHRIDLPAPTAARIETAIATLGYRPNLLAKRLSTGRSEAVSLVTPEIDNPFFASLAAAVEEEAGRHGYAVFMSSTRGDVERELASLRRLADRHVDGMILMTNRPDDGTLAAAVAGSPPIVLIDEAIPQARLPGIYVENEAGALLATRHLIGRGHRHIALLGGPAELLSVRERGQGFMRAMAEAGLTPSPEHVRFGQYTRDFGRAATRALLEAPDRPTAIFATSDYIAIGVFEALRAAGLSVPGDISLVGFDDMPFVEIMTPALTTVRQPIAEMGRLGFQTLLALMIGETVATERRLPVELVERDSVGPPARVRT
jgi:LacI family transcriptional regulator